MVVRVKDKSLLVLVAILDAVIDRLEAQLGHTGAVNAGLIGRCESLRFDVCSWSICREYPKADRIINGENRSAWGSSNFCSDILKAGLIGSIECIREETERDGLAQSWSRINAWLKSASGAEYGSVD